VVGRVKDLKIRLVAIIILRVKHIVR
jgi:hypothetical protein